MIKFFRKARMKLLSENRLSKYLIYAVGEIALVIVGILIALSINNWNENRKNEIKIRSMLKQVQEELASNIEMCDETIEFYREKDSLIYLILNKKVSYEDYKENKIPGLEYVIYNNAPLKIRDNGFNTLLDNTSIISKKYMPVFSELKDLYKTKSEMEQLNKGLEKVVHSVFDYEKRNTNMPVNYYTDNLNDEGIDYYLTNTFYLNSVAEYYTFSVENHYFYVLGFRNEAVKIHRKIADLLNRKKSDSESFSLALTKAQRQNIVGTYSHGKDKVEISSKGDKMFFSSPDKKRRRCFLLVGHSLLRIVSHFLRPSI